MEYEDRIICFIDILGFQEIISHTLDSSGNTITKKVEILEDAFSKIIYFLDTECPNEFSESKMVTQFSDCVVISFKCSEKSEVFSTLLDIQLLLINLVYHGMICRGGIVSGKIIHTEKMIFGPGLIDAYILESKGANYPRIIVDEAVLEVAKRYRAHHHTVEEELDSVMRILGKDIDGMYYIDYFASAQSGLDDPELDFPEYLEELSKIIAQGITSSKPDIKVKYNWLKQNYNRVVKRCRDKFQPSQSEDYNLGNAYHSLRIFE